MLKKSQSVSSSQTVSPLRSESTTGEPNDKSHEITGTITPKGRLAIPPVLNRAGLPDRTTSHHLVEIEANIDTGALHP